jgi:hypothetical protein
MKVQFMMNGIAAAGLLLAAAFSSAQTDSLRAGAARVDITPPKEMFPLQNTLLFSGAHDPIYARALVLDNGKAKFAIVVLDLLDLMIDNGLRKDVADELKIPVDNVLLNVPHDNTSLLISNNLPNSVGKEPNQDTPVFANIRKGVLEAARKADESMQPARIGYGTGKAYVNVQANNPDGPSDKTVSVLELTSLSGEPIAFYTSYAVHSIVMYRSVMDDGKVYLSSDLAGWTSKYVEDHFPGAVSVWGLGSGLDQTPLFTSRSGPGEEDHNEGSAGWALLDAQSRRLGAEIVRVIKSIQNTSGQAMLWSTKSSVSCPAQPRPSPAGRPSGPGQAQIPSPMAGLPGQVAIPFKASDDVPMTIPLQLLMVNDIAIAGVYGDHGVEIGLRIKQNSIFDKIMVVSLAPNKVGHLQSDPQGCVNRSIDEEFQKMMKIYMPVWKAVR